MDPTFFELLAADHMVHFVHSAYDKIFQKISQYYPALHTSLEWKDEIFYLLKLLVDRYYIKYHGSSFSLDHFGLRFEPLVNNENQFFPVRFSATKRYLILLVINAVPYIMHRVRQLYLKWSQEYTDDGFENIHYLRPNPTISFISFQQCWQDMLHERKNRQYMKTHHHIPSSSHATSPSTHHSTQVTPYDTCLSTQDTIEMLPIFQNEHFSTSTLSIPTTTSGSSRYNHQAFHTDAIHPATVITTAHQSTSKPLHSSIYINAPSVSAQPHSHDEPIGSHHFRFHPTFESTKQHKQATVGGVESTAIVASSSQSVLPTTTTSIPTSSSQSQPMSETLSVTLPTATQAMDNTSLSSSPSPSPTHTITYTPPTTTDDTLVNHLRFLRASFFRMFPAFFALWSPRSLYTKTFARSSSPSSSSSGPRAQSLSKAFSHFRSALLHTAIHFKLLYNTALHYLTTNRDSIILSLKYAYIKYFPICGGVIEIVRLILKLSFVLQFTSTNMWSAGLRAIGVTIGRDMYALLPPDQKQQIDERMALAARESAAAATIAASVPLSSSSPFLAGLPPQTAPTFPRRYIPNISSSSFPFSSSLSKIFPFTMSSQLFQHNRLFHALILSARHLSQFMHHSFQHTMILLRTLIDFLGKEAETVGIAILILDQFSQALVQQQAAQQQQLLTQIFASGDDNDLGDGATVNDDPAADFFLQFENGDDDDDEGVDDDDSNHHHQNNNNIDSTTDQSISNDSNTTSNVSSTDSVAGENTTTTTTTVYRHANFSNQRHLEVLQQRPLRYLFTSFFGLNHHFTIPIQRRGNSNTSQTHIGNFNTANHAAIPPEIGPPQTYWSVVGKQSQDTVDRVIDAVFEPRRQISVPSRQALLPQAVLQQQISNEKQSATATHPETTATTTTTTTPTPTPSSPLTTPSIPSTNQSSASSTSLLHVSQHLNSSPSLSSLTSISPSFGPSSVSLDPPLVLTEDISGQTRRTNRNEVAADDAANDDDDDDDDDNDTTPHHHTHHNSHAARQGRAFATTSHSASHSRHTSRESSPVTAAGRSHALHSHSRTRSRSRSRSRQFTAPLTSLSAFQDDPFAVVNAPADQPPILDVPAHNHDPTTPLPPSTTTTTTTPQSSLPPRDVQVALSLDTSLCSLCHKNIRAFAVTTTGFVACYGCLHQYVESYQQCPFTLVPMSVDQIRSIWIK